VGTGLGLSIVRGILEKHGCTVQMVSALGVGTTCWFVANPTARQSSPRVFHGDFWDRISFEALQPANNYPLPKDSQ